MKRFLLALAFMTTTAQGQMFPEQNDGDIELAPPDEPAPSLIGGTVVSPADYPASFASRQGNSGCTATLIGPQVLQLAAHCVGNGRTAVITIAGTSYTGTCTHNPNYSRDSTSDWALCKMPAPVPVAAYENVNADAGRPRVGGTMLLCGMGCTTAGGNDNTFGTFRCGTATIQSVPTRDNDIVTRGGAALCYGDSGGSSFCTEGANRWVCGVNSRGNIRDTSYLSAVHKGVPWYTTWATAQGVKICGIHGDAPNCRGRTPDEPVDCQALYETLGHCYEMKGQELPTCRETYTKFGACILGG